jgi:flagellar biosynthesis anti-sigma factor FlgM
MKVPGSDKPDLAINRSQELRTGDQGTVRRASTGEAAAVGQEQSQAAKTKADSIRVSSLGALLQSELNPAKMAEERAQKVAALKEQIRNGTYAPDSQAVARSLAEELYLEISGAESQE